MRLAGKILGILTGAAIALAAVPDLAYAQQMPATSDADATSRIKAMSAFEFAKKTNGMLVVTELAKAKTEDIEKFLEKYLPCQNQACDRETQKCIKGTASKAISSGGSTYGGSQSTTITESIHCQCVDKNATASDFDHWSWSAFGTLRYQDAPDGCDGTVSHNIAIGALGAFEYSNKEICYDNSSDGNRYCAFLHGDKTTIHYANGGSENAAIRGCEVLPVKLYNYRKCFFCPLVGVIYDGVSKMADVSFAKLARALATLLAIGFAIWIAIQVLTQVSSLTKQDAPKFLAGLIKQSYKVVIAFTLLQYSNQVFTYIINPLIETGLTFGKNMLTTRDVFRGINYDKDGNYIRQASITGGVHLNLDTYDKLEQYVVAVQQEIAFMQAIGGSLVCTGTSLMMGNELTTWQKIKASMAPSTWGFIGSKQFGKWADMFGDGFQMFLQGATLAIFGFLLSIAFAFYLIDAIVQVGIVGALLPFLIACWPFKPTAKYTSTGVNMLMNSAFVFLFMGLVISVNIMLVNEALNQAADEQKDEQLTLCGEPAYYKQNPETCDALLKDTPRMGALYKIADAINSQDANRLKELTDISALGFLILLFCCIFGFKFTGQAIALAGKFASGATGKPIAPGIATAAASGAKSFALKATEDTREAIGHKVERAADRVVTKPFRMLKAGYNKLRGKDQKDGGAAAKGGASTPNPQAGNTGGAAAAAAQQQTAAQANNGQPVHTNAAGDANNNKSILNEGSRGNAGTPRLNEDNAADDFRDNEDELPTDDDTPNNEAAETETAAEAETETESTSEPENSGENGYKGTAAEQRRRAKAAANGKTMPPPAPSARQAAKIRQMQAASGAGKIKKQDYRNHQSKGGSQKNRGRWGKNRKK